MVRLTAKILPVLLAASLASACIVTAPIRTAADVTGDAVRGAVDVVTPDGEKKN